MWWFWELQKARYAMMIHQLYPKANGNTIEQTNADIELAGKLANKS
jgi:hypothetical protein